MSKQVSIVVTTHSEGALFVPCINSVLASITYAEKHQISSEIIVVCDNASTETLDVVTKLEKTVGFKIIRTNFSNPGEARNEGIRNSSGKYVGIIDGDDLVSENWILNSFLSAVDSHKKAVFHPELILSFGDRPSIFKMKNTLTESVSYFEILENNLWASPVFGQKNIFLETPYRNLQGNSGFGPEDWAWNIDLMAAGIHHGIAKSTVYLYRTSSTTGVNSTHGRSLLPELKISKLKQYFPSSLDIQNSETVLSVSNEAIRQKFVSTYYKIKWLFRPLVAISPIFARKIYLVARRIYAKAIKQPVSSLQSFRSENYNPIIELPREDFQVLYENLAKLSWLEPQAAWPVIEHSLLPVWEPKPSKYGEVLTNFCDFVGTDPETCLIFVPWVGLGGADLVSLNYARALKQKFSESRIIIVTTLSEHLTDPKLIPNGIELHQLPEDFQKLDLHQRAKLLAQAIVEIKPGLVLNVNSPELFESLRLYSLPMSKKSSLYFAFFCFDKSIDGVPIHHAFEGSRDYLANLRGIFTDNDVVRNQLTTMFGLESSFVTTHHSPFDFLGNNVPTISTFNQGHQRLRLLWAHRIDRQKRPEVLNKIAGALREKGIDFQIDLYGKSVLSNKTSVVFDGSIKLYGEFSGGLYGIDTSGYDAFLITSEWEGLPTVLLQAVDLGIPIIATNVGGISDVIIDGTTGFLVSSPEDIEGFVRAIEQISISPSKAKQMAIQARKIIKLQHSWEQFQSAVFRDLTLNNSAQDPS